MKLSEKQEEKLETLRSEYHGHLIRNFLIAAVLITMAFSCIYIKINVFTVVLLVLSLFGIAFMVIDCFMVNGQYSVEANKILLGFDCEDETPTPNSEG